MYFQINYFAVSNLLVRIFYYIYAPFLWLLLRNQGHIRKTKNPILKYSIEDVTSNIKSKEIKCESLLRTYIERIKEVNPKINAVVQNRFAEALKEAKKVDLMIENGENTDDKPLLGVPFTVKQIFPVKGLSSRNGSLHQPQDQIYKADCEVVSRLKAAGAIPLLISNTPEISCGYETYNHVTGVTRNPFNFSRSAGGSSGGEATLIATDSTCFGIGSDAAGSIRLPSHFNGICGHKPTPGLVNSDDVYPIFKDSHLQERNVCGPMAKSIDDLKVIFKIMTGGSPALKLDEKLQAGGVKVLYTTQLAERLIMTNVDDEIKFKIEKIATKLSEKFSVHGFNRNKFYFIPEAATSKIVMDSRYPHLLQERPQYLAEPQKAMKRNASWWLKEALKSFVGLSKFTFSLIFFEFICCTKGSMCGQAEIWKSFADNYSKELIKTLSDDTVLIMPTFPTAAVHHSTMFFRTVDATYITIANAFGLPSTQVPVGFNKEGLPIGIQVLGGPKMDWLTLEVAKEIESIVKS